MKLGRSKYAFVYFLLADQFEAVGNMRSRILDLTLSLLRHADSGCTV
jgi:hypothetical protein